MCEVARNEIERGAAQLGCLPLQCRGGSPDIQLGSLEALLIRWNSPDSFQPIQTLFRGQPA